jgi:hypothetical protein
MPRLEAASSGGNSFDVISNHGHCLRREFGQRTRTARSVYPYAVPETVPHLAENLS